MTTFYKGEIAKEDFNLGLSTFLRRNSLGGYDELNQISRFTFDIDWYKDVRDYSSFEGAIDSFGSNEGTLFITEILDIPSNVNTNNVFLHFIPGCYLRPATGVVITVNSPEHIIANSRQKIVDNTYNTLNPLEFVIPGKIYPTWFGAIADETTNCTTAIQNSLNAAVDGSTIFFPNGKYKLIGGVTLLNKTVNIEGSSPDSVYLIQSTSGGFDFIGIVNDNFYMDKMSFQGISLIAGTANSGTAIKYTYIGGSGYRAMGPTIDNVRFLPATPTDFWDIGVRGINVRDAYFSRVVMQGKANAVTGGMTIGFYLDGDSDPVEIQFNDCHLNTMTDGIIISGEIEGVYLNCCKIWQTMTGVTYEPDTPQGVFLMSQCYIQGRICCVDLDNVSYFQISCCNFEGMNYLGTGEYFGILIDRSNEPTQVNFGTIMNNHFNGTLVGPAYDQTGIRVINAAKTRIANNSFFEMENGIEVLAGDEIEVYNNNYQVVTTPLIAPASTRLVSDEAPELICWLHHNASQSIPVSVETRLEFDDEIYDTSNYYDASTDRFTPPRGYYRMSIAARLTTNVEDGDVIILGLERSGSIERKAEVTAARTGLAFVRLDCITFATGSDFFEAVLEITTGTGAARLRPDNSHFNYWHVEAIR
jgi:hypothetical protein